MQYDNLPGRSSENAKKALALAVERGFAPELVLTNRDGYMIPIQDEDTKVPDSHGEAPTAKKPARTRTKKKE